VAHSHSPTILWFMGLSENAVHLVGETAGTSYVCRPLDDLSPGDLHALLDTNDDPLLLWMGMGARTRMEHEHPRLLQALGVIPTVLVLEPNPDPEVLERAIDAHVQQVLRSPLGKAQIFDALGRARETRNLFQDVTRMSREISMERELLERKSGVCSFLFRFFTLAAEATDAKSALVACRQALERLLPVSGLHILWQDSPCGTVYISESVHAHSRQSRKDWPLLMWKQMESLRIGHTTLSARRKTEIPPVISFPLAVNKSVRGLLTLELREHFPFGKDIALALESMRLHLALMLREGEDREAFFADCLTSDRQMELMEA